MTNPKKIFISKARRRGRHDGRVEPSMKIGVYSFEKVLYQGEAISVNCNTKMGEITILNHHRPLISILGKGTDEDIDGPEKSSIFP